MRVRIDRELCAELGLHDGQIRSRLLYKNLWWSFDHAQTVFGYGDLDKKDLDRIYEWLKKPENQDKVFTGWNEHHCTRWQQTKYAIVRISFAAGLTRPYNAILEDRFGASKL